VIARPTTESHVAKAQAPQKGTHTIDITRAGGQSKFKIQPDELFDAEVEDLLWTVDTNKDFRIVQFRVYQE
jgi:hypothetical protein